MNNEELLKARKAVDHILHALGVARVVYVDDKNDESITLSDVIAAIPTLAEAELLNVFPELGDTLPDDPDVLAEKVRSIWGSIDSNGQANRGLAVLIAARRHDGEDDTDDIADMSIMRDLVAEEKLLRLTPKQWEAQKEELLHDNQDHPILFLFDRDFSSIGGDPEGGIKIIASLIARKDIGRIICGLLTHTVRPETQPEEWDKLSRTHEIPKDRFVVIPKLHLSQDPILFAQLLKFTVLSPDFDELKRKTKEIIAEAAKAAADQVDEVSIYDLHHIVFQVSAEEGLWEPDMLFRLHTLFHHLESRRLAHEDGLLETIAARLRALSEVPMKSHSFKPPSSAWKLQRDELYEFENHINKHYLPLELGDIFERVGSESVKQFILLAQPCDLMVRQSGRRQPEMERVPVAEVTYADSQKEYSEEMPYFDESPNKRWYIKLRRIHFVRTCILDLCVFNQDGLAKLQIAGDAPSGIRPTWKKRHKFLSDYWMKSINKADLLAPSANEPKPVTQKMQQLSGQLRGLFFDDDLFKGSIIETDGKRALTFDCRRVRRLSRSRALGFLMSYTSTLGRPAYDRDFGIGREKDD